MIVVDATINPATADFIRESISTAALEGASALILQLDTPGGLLDSTKSIVKDILGAPLPVIVYVAPSGSSATSAGVFITMAGAVAAMAPGTSIGAAHPVGAQGESIDGDLGEKVENFAASMGKSIAQERGRNVDWAEKAVRESVSVTESEALKLKVVDLVADSVDDLLRQTEGRKVEVRNHEVTLHLSGAMIVVREMRLKQKVLNILANPNVAYLLMMAGMLGMYVEFTSPGLIFPGVAGAICLLLGLASLQVLPINYTGLALIALGLALLVSELFLPSFGVLGVGGIVSFVLGSLLLFDTPESDLAVDPMNVYAAAAVLGGFTLIAGYLVVGSQRQRSAVGLEGMIGTAGEVRQRIGGQRQAGKVFVHGELWNARADGPIEAGAEVEITAAEGMTLVVRPLRSARGSSEA
jgi:membrane-bound serine protease (ClpP class)